MILQVRVVDHIFGSSTNNSVLNLAFGYNGTERLLGQSTGTGGAFPGMNSKNKGKAGNMPGGNKPSQSKNGNMKKPSGTKPSGSMKKPSGQIGQGGPGGNNQAPGKNQKIANSTKTKQPSNSMKKSQVVKWVVKNLAKWVRVAPEEKVAVKEPAEVFLTLVRLDHLESSKQLLVNRYHGSCHYH